MNGQHSKAGEATTEAARRAALVGADGARPGSARMTIRGLRETELAYRQVELPTRWPIEVGAAEQCAQVAWREAD